MTPVSKQPHKSVRPSCWYNGWQEIVNHSFRIFTNGVMSTPNSIQIRPSVLDLHHSGRTWPVLYAFIWRRTWWLSACSCVWQWQLSVIRKYPSSVRHVLWLVATCPCVYCSCCFLASTSHYDLHGHLLAQGWALVFHLGSRMCLFRSDSRPAFFARKIVYLEKC